MSDRHIAQGFRFGSLHCGVRPGRDRSDLALIVSDVPASAAGVFTQNRVRAAPVRVSQERVPRGDSRGIIVCAGNANACTGKRGMEDARRMAQLAAEVTGCGVEQMLVASTGVIGRHLPMENVEKGIRDVVHKLDGGQKALVDAADAILTTDTRNKISTRVVNIQGVDFRLTGFAKGAAMIGPNMATMLAFVCTDAPVAHEDLQTIARRAAAQTFNCVRVEGHTSTNDSLFILANGQGRKLDGEGLARFASAATEVCGELGRAIAEDAEGASHFITIDVEGLRDDHEAAAVARAVADSALIKTAVFGADPNWGRIVSAAGYAGVMFEEEHLSLWLGDMLLYHEGTPQAFDPATASAYLKNNRAVRMRLLFTLGTGRCTMWTSDLTYDYVRINAEYTT